MARTTRLKNIEYSDQVSNEGIAAVVQEQKDDFEAAEKAGKRKLTMLLFIDDAGDDARSKDLTAQLSKLYTKGRHFGISTIVACQSVTGQLSRKQKNCTTEWIVFKSNSEDMKLLAKMLTSAFATEKEVMADLTSTTQEPFSFA
ncbi:hypothetical protein HKX48_008275 [Thoreauomyces humboldtii]|nr:hypothetical protein HKX48_008275 [Thoreauomyces humboldtii]